MEILANLWTLYLQFNRTQKFGQTLTHLLCDKIIYEITDVQSRGRAARGTQRENQKMFLRINVIQFHQNQWLLLLCVMYCHEA